MALTFDIEARVNLKPMGLTKVLGKAKLSVARQQLRIL